MGGSSPLAAQALSSGLFRKRLSLVGGSDSAGLIRYRAAPGRHPDMRLTAIHRLIGAPARLLEWAFRAGVRPWKARRAPAFSLEDPRGQVRTLGLIQSFTIHGSRPRVVSSGQIPPGPGRVFRGSSVRSIGHDVLPLFALKKRAGCDLLNAVFRHSRSRMLIYG